MEDRDKEQQGELTNKRIEERRVGVEQRGSPSLRAAITSKAALTSPPLPLEVSIDVRDELHFDKDDDYDKDNVLDSSSTSLSRKRDKEDVAVQRVEKRRRSETGISSTAQGSGSSNKGKERSLEGQSLPYPSQPSSIILSQPSINSSSSSREGSQTSRRGNRSRPSGSGTEERSRLPTSQPESSVSSRIITSAASISVSPPSQSLLASALSSQQPPSTSYMDQIRYLLHILQQPTIGCAFGSNLLSRLAVAPPLIVQLQAIDRAGKEVLL